MSNRLKRIYVAGPMRNRVRYGFEDFDDAREHLTRHGYEVVSPADLDRREGFDPWALPADHDWSIAPTTLDIKRVFARDLAALATCDAIYMLEGWNTSLGAKAELSAASVMGLEVFYECDDDYVLTVGAVEKMRETMRLDLGACPRQIVTGKTMAEKTLLAVPPFDASAFAKAQEDWNIYGKFEAGKKDLLRGTNEFAHLYEPQAGSALPVDAAARKTYPMYSGLLAYFPDALALVSHVSHVGNEQHNPGQPLHWAKEKSQDEPDALIRHMVDTEWDKVAWRALANLQRKFEAGWRPV